MVVIREVEQEVTVKKVGEGSMRRFQGAGGLSPDIKGVEWHRVVMLHQHVAEPH